MNSQETSQCHKNTRRRWEKQCHLPQRQITPALLHSFSPGPAPLFTLPGGHHLLTVPLPPLM